MDKQQRRNRITELTTELQSLIREEQQELLISDLGELNKLRTQGKLIQAIQKYRAITGCSLREAKDFVENMR